MTALDHHQKKKKEKELSHLVINDHLLNTIC